MKYLLFLLVLLLLSGCSINPAYYTTHLSYTKYTEMGFIISPLAIPDVSVIGSVSGVALKGYDIEIRIGYDIEYLMSQVVLESILTGGDGIMLFSLLYIDNEAHIFGYVIDRPDVTIPIFEAKYPHDAIRYNPVSVESDEYDKTGDQ